MRIERIELKNFLAFRGMQALDLPAGPIGIFARYTDNAQRSNWAGKTALLRAIRYAIDGSHHKRTDDEVIHHGEADMMVSIVLGSLKITREKTRGKVTVLTVGRGGDVAKGDDAKAWIEDAVRMSGADLESTLIFEQGDIESLCARDAAERRAVVTRWLKLEAWGAYGKLAREQQRDAESRHEAANRILAGIDARAPMGSIERDAAGASSAVEDLAEVKEQIEFLKIEIPRLEAELTAWRSANADSHVLEDLRAKGRELTVTNERMRAHPPPADGVIAEIDARLMTATSALDAAKQEKRKHLAVISDGFDGSCPVTKTPCLVPDDVSSKLEAVRVLASSAERVAFDAQRVVEEVNRERIEAMRIDREAVGMAARRQEIMNDMRRMRERVDAWRARLALVAPVDEPAIIAQLSELRSSLVQCTQTRGALTLEIEREDGYEREREGAVAEVRKWGELARLRSLVTKALGPTGIVSRIAARQITKLEARANDLLAGTGLSFVFAWERETKDLTPTCYECGFVYKGKRDKTCPGCGVVRGMKRRDDLEILVDDESGQDPEDVSTKSGGAKVLVASAIRLAGGMMLREQRDSPVRFALVDEPFGALDLANKTLLAQTFAGLLGSVGLEQALVVSHDEALLDALPVKIMVIREGDASRVVMETSNG